MVYLNFTEKKKDCLGIALVKKGGVNQNVLYLHTEQDEPNHRQKFKEINLQNGEKFEIVPTAEPNKRDIFYICGASGSGKSYIAGEIAKNYKKLFPKNEIYLISKLTQDETLDSLTIGKPKRINIESILDDPPNIEEFRECLVIFDDYDSLTGKLSAAIHTLINDIATMGRHTHTHMILCSHFFSNYSKTRLILNEATHYVLYPQASAFSSLKNMLMHYLGMEMKDIKDLKKLKSRWVCFHKNFPQYQLSEFNCKILHQ